MDLYLLPVGLYLLTVGYLQEQRQQTARAQSLWIADLMITPAFLAFWSHTGDIHTLLFVSECLLAAVWGIWQRIRDFVLVGTGFIALYAATVAAGHLPDVWATLVTLLIGIALFVAGFYIRMHCAIMQQWVAAIDRQWKAWQAWH